MNDTEDTKPHLTPEGKFALLMIACMLPLFVIFLVLGKPELGVTVSVSGAIVAAALRSTWAEHNHAWYWIAVAVAISLQPLFIVHIPWKNRAFRGTSLLPFGLLNFLVVWGCIKIAEKVMTRTPQ